MKCAALFSEVARLLPGTRLRLHLMGPDGPAALHGRSVALHPPFNKAEALELMPYDGIGGGDGGREQEAATDESACRCTFWQGLYHELVEGPDAVQLPPPDIVICANAGLPAYMSWLPTLKCLHRSVQGARRGRRLPVVFTDFCEEAAWRSVELIKSVLGRDVDIPVQLNPFRSPVRRFDHGTALPAYSNCYMFGIILTQGDESD